ncbi:MAG: hypothetical protein IPJ15_00285 [Actinomycetales bacterium]|jgi:hypothetical protein|nr:hypothetical protein [Candidatus Phosphoribacter baldrii]MBK7609792.1 hypothetical protein [Candidatus Phosphoribacter baldrii]HRC12991.1 hypothetical protein [Dermatophilaceae bacterium]
MVTPLRGTDPGSVSQLGGILRTTAAALAAGAAELHPGTPLVTLCVTTATHLDSMGSALQVQAQELAEAAVARSRLRERATAAGLELREWSVIEPFGVVSAEVAARRSLDQAQLQAQADRLAAQVARTRSRLVRELAQARAHLAQAAEVARART